MSFHPYGGSGPSICPIAHFRLWLCSEFQKPRQTTTEQGKAKLCLFNSKTTWNAVGSNSWVSKILTMWFQNWVYVARLHLAQQQSDQVVSKLSIRSSASPRTAAVWQAFWNSDHVVLKSNIHSSALPRSAAAVLAFWNSDHVVLKSSIRSSASPRSAAVWLGFWNSDYVVLKSSIRNFPGTLTLWF